MKIGYACVLSEDQNSAVQLETLRAAGCERVFEDAAGGSKTDRPGLAEALALAHEGDELIVCKLDRIGRSLSHLIKLVEALRRRKIGFRSLSENIGTEPSAGKLATPVFAALAEFERDLVRERTRASLAVARARGRKGGRKPLSPDKIAALQALWDENRLTAREIGDQLGIHRASVFKYVKGRIAALPPSESGKSEPHKSD